MPSEKLQNTRLITTGMCALITLLLSLLGVGAPVMPLQSAPAPTPTPTPTATPPPNGDGPLVQLGTVDTVAGRTVTVPLSYTSNGHNIISMVFAVDLGESCLQFDPTDDDNNGRPDAVTFQLPTGYNGSATLNSSGSAEQLNFVIIDPTPPLIPLPNSTLAAITFQVRETAACRPILDSPLAVAVNFAATPSVSFGSNTGTSVPGRSENGMVTIHPLHAGDGNGDGAVDAGDLAACVLEIFDGDGSDPVDVENGSFRGTTGCDANGDTTIDAGDLSCVVLLIFAGPGSCSTTPIDGTASAQLIIGRPGAVADGSYTFPIKFAGQGHAIAASAFALEFDTPIDPTDEDGNGLPDAIAVTGMAEEQIVTASWQGNQLHIAITEEISPFAAFADGPLVLVTLPATALHADVMFATDVPPSLGNTDGRSVPVESQVEPLRILLPTVMR